ncbi:MAG TPA: hypothetical protein VNZ47_11810 [Candidatus Dormibacteraeota bacterium]|nr:hypothetical protein [Candidatus Dormibacteraeota bacterium]
MEPLPVEEPKSPAPKPVLKPVVPKIVLVRAPAPLEPKSVHPPTSPARKAYLARKAKERRARQKAAKLAASVAAQ